MGLWKQKSGDATSEAQNPPTVGKASDYVVVEPAEEKLLDGTGTVRAHDVHHSSLRKGDVTSRSDISGATNGTTVSRLCHYLEDSLQKISQATEQLESAGTEYSIEELDSMFNKTVLPELQRVVLRSGNMEVVQLDILVAELESLVDATDRCLDPGTKSALQAPLSKLSRMLTRLKTSHDQAVTAKTTSLAATSGPLALPPQENGGPEDSNTRALTMQMQTALAQQQQQTELMEKRMQAMIHESLRQQQMMYTSNRGGSQLYPHYNTDGTTAIPGAPITIHNHLAANQAAEATSSTKHIAQHIANLAQTVSQKLKHAAGGPMGFVFAGVAGLVARDLVGRYVTRGSGKLQRNQGRAIAALKKERKIIAREAQRQLHACERAFHETKNHAMKPIRMPFDKPSVECSPNYDAFEEHDY